MFDIDAFPTPVDDFAPGLAPAPAPEPEASEPIERPSARAAAIRRAEAERKREERAKRRADGIPDPRMVDAAIIKAVVAASVRRGHPQTIAKTKALSGLAISLQEILVGSLKELVEVKGVGQKQAKGAVLVRLSLAR